MIYLIFVWCSVCSFGMGFLVGLKRGERGFRRDSSSVVNEKYWPKPIIDFEPAQFVDPVTFEQKFDQAKSIDDILEKK